MPALIDRTGKKYGRWVVLREDLVRRGSWRCWWAACSCPQKTLRSMTTHALQVARRNNGGCGSACDRPKGSSGLTHLFEAQKRSAKARGHAWKLSVEEFGALVREDCFYCFAPPEIQERDVRQWGAFVRNGVDRVENEIGYVVSNCVPCCPICNFGKRNKTLLAFARHHQRIRELKDGIRYSDPEHVHKEWLARLAARNFSAIQVAAA